MMTIVCSAYMAQCRLHTIMLPFVLFVQAQLWQLTQRTTSLPLGRGAFTLATIYTLLTEVLMLLCFYIYFHQLIFYEIDYLKIYATFSDGISGNFT